MKSEIVYRIYHSSKALIWASMSRDYISEGGWSSDDGWAVEFGNTDEEYEQAKALAEKVNGVVEECSK